MHLSILGQKPGENTALFTKQSKKKGPRTKITRSLETKAFRMCSRSEQYLRDRGI